MQIQPTRLLRFRKYLIPVEVPKLPRQTEPAPTGRASLAELLVKFPGQVQVKALPDEQLTLENQLPWQFRVVRQGRVDFQSLPVHDHRPAQVAIIKQGSSVGRACCLVGPGNNAIVEAGFHFDVDRLVKSLKLGRFHPYLNRYRAQGDLQTRANLPAATEIRGTVAAINNRAAHNFYHWLIEIAPRIAALDMAGIESDYFLIDCQSRFQQSVLGMLGIPQDRIVQPHCRMHVRSDEMIFVPQTSRAVLKHFVAMLDKSIQSDPTANRLLYISRRQARNRRIVNEKELERYLIANGFETVCFENLAVADQFRLLRESATIVTAHGAALANTIFARPGTNIIEIFPRRRSNLTLYPGLSQAMNLQHTSVLGEYTPVWRNIRVAISDVEFALEQLHSRCNSARAA